MLSRKTVATKNSFNNCLSQEYKSGYNRGNYAEKEKTITKNEYKIYY